MTFSNPDSLQVRMHSYPFIVSLCFSHHFSFFVILSFTIKIMFYFLPLKKKSPVFPPYFHSQRSHGNFYQVCHALIPPSFQFTWGFRTFLFTFLFNWTYNEYYYTDPHLLEAQNQTPLLTFHTCCLPLSQQPNSPFELFSFPSFRDFSSFVLSHFSCQLLC